MNETIKNLIERRSCRKYKSEQIKDEELNLIFYNINNTITI